MIDVTTEKLLDLAAAARCIPPARGGKRTHCSTVLRWLTIGTKGPNGERIRLEGVRIGHRWLTSKEALQRFSESLTPHLDDAPTPTPRSPARRQRASERAAEQLERAGI